MSRPEIVFSNAESVSNQIGWQNVSGSVYYGNVHYHSGSPLSPISANLRGKQVDGAKVISKKTREQQLAEERAAKLDDINFQQLEIRHATIEKAHQKTCRWFLQRDEYTQWLNGADLNEKHGLLWIKGKPGSGKSTLMKYLASVAATQISQAPSSREGEERNIVTFFFNARGTLLEKTTLGAYRSMLYQLIRKLPDLINLLDEMPVITIQTLQGVIERAITRLRQRSLILFIDALDECGDEEVQEMVSFFEDLCAAATSSKTQLRVCLSSRHYPFITITYGTSIVLEDQIQHDEDMMHYVQSTLVIGKGDIASRIRQKILDKASGVFLWTKLVVKILNRKYRSGRMFELDRYLDTIPSDLEELFKGILAQENDEDEDSRREMMLCIRWVLFAKEPLSLVELYFAVLAGSQDDFSPVKDHDVDESDLERFILACSRGLLEETRGTPKTIQFIHESVRTYFLRDNRLAMSETSQEVTAESYSQLANCCLNYIKAVIILQKTAWKDFKFSSVSIESSEEPNEEKKRECRFRGGKIEDMLPFLKYATTHILFHSDAAEREGISQVDFISEFSDLECSTLSRFKFEAQKEPVPLLYRLAKQNLPSLISLYLESATEIEPRGGRYGYPLVVAARKGNREALNAMLACTSRNASITDIDDPDRNSDPATDTEQSIVYLLGNSTHFHANRKPSCRAAELGNRALLRCLLRTKKVNLNKHPADGTYALFSAASRGYWYIVELLLKYRAKVDSYSGLDPLQVACERGHAKVAEILLGHERYRSENTDGANSDNTASISRERVQYAFFAACKNGHIPAVRLLLRAGADVNEFSYRRQRALHIAAEKGHDLLIAFLIGSGASKDAVTSAGETPLWLSSENGHEKAVAKLIELSADINIQSGLGESPLHAAAKYGHTNVVKSLLDAGADIGVRCRATDTTALQAACLTGHSETAKVLLKYHSTGNEQQNSQRELLTSLIDSTSNEHDFKLSIDETIYLAARNGSSGMIKWLASIGVDIYSTTSPAGTLLNVATKRGQEKVVEVLLILDVQEKFQRSSVLHEAIHLRKWGICTLLLRSGISLSEIDLPSYTSLLLHAIKMEERSVTAMMIKYGIAQSIINLEIASDAISAAVELKKPHILRSLLEDTYFQGILKTQHVSLFQMAQRKGHTDIMKLLFDLGSGVNFEYPDGCSPLLVSVQKDNSPQVGFLLSLGADPNFKSSSHNRTCLCEAVNRGNEDITNKLLQAGARPQLTGPNGDLPLTLAYLGGKPRLVSILTNTSANARAFEKSDLSKQLRVASLKGLLGLARFAVKHGVDVNQVDANGKTPLINAISYNHWQTARFLLASGADVNLHVGQEGTALHFAAKLDNAKAVTFLLSSSADVHARSLGDDRTAYDNSWGTEVKEILDTAMKGAAS